MSIRTTVTLDEDVLDRVKQVSRRRGTSFKETLNELLRAALLGARPQARRPKFRVKPLQLRPLPGLNYDDIEGLISYAEGEDHR